MRPAPYFLMPLSVDQDQELSEILHSLDVDKLRGWDLQFITDMIDQYENNPDQMFVSGKMWKNLRRIYLFNTGEVK